MKNWQWLRYATIIVETIVFVYALLLIFGLQQQVGALTERVATLEAQNQKQEEDLAGLSTSIVESRVEALDYTSELVTGILSYLEQETADLDWWINWLRQGQDRVYGYFSDSVLVEVDQSITPEMGLEISTGGDKSTVIHPTYPSFLIKLETPFLIRLGDTTWVDLSDELQFGDRLQVWCNPNQPTSGVSFWDAESCLVLNLQHLDGVYAPITR